MATLDNSCFYSLSPNHMNTACPTYLRILTEKDLTIQDLVQQHQSLRFGRHLQLVTPRSQPLKWVPQLPWARA